LGGGLGGDCFANRLRAIIIRVDMHTNGRV
jgi:hypothetical protein